MTTNAHTPTPWEVGDLDHNGQRIVRGEHIEICTCWHHSVGSIEREMEANAAFIVRAVNSIDELAEALRRVAAWKDAVSMIAPELGGLLTAMYAADAALAKLEAA